MAGNTSPAAQAAAMHPCPRLLKERCYSVLMSSTIHESILSIWFPDLYLQKQSVTFSCYQVDLKHFRIPGVFYQQSCHEEVSGEQAVAI